MAPNTATLLCFPLFLFFIARAGQLPPAPKIFAASCDAVSSVARPWLNRHGLSVTNIYRCGVQEADCLDLTGKRIHDAQGKRIWRLSRYYMWPEGGQSLRATSVDRHSRND